MICSAMVGSIELCCYYYDIGKHSKPRWCADISIRRISGTFMLGPMRKSLDEAKNDAVLLARKLLLDFQICLDIEKKKFGIME